MPLSSAAAPRDHIHTRQVECTGYRRADGLWDIEGHITDTKTYAYQTDERGAVPVGAPVHDMWIRMTVDSDLVVQAIEAVTDAAPFPDACPLVATNYQRVVGLKIGTGWNKALKERLGGVQGCTHLLELLAPIATTAFQTIAPIKAREENARTTQGGDKPRAFVLLNTCYAFRSDGAVVRKYAPDHYTGEDKPENGSTGADPASTAG